MLVKYQREDERLPSIEDVRKRLAGGGMDVARLEDEGRLHLVTEDGKPGERMGEVERLLAEERVEGRTVWANFNWDLHMGVEEALEQQRALTGFVEGSDLVLKTTVLEEDLDGWPGSLQRQAGTLGRGDRRPDPQPGTGEGHTVRGRRPERPC